MPGLAYCILARGKGFEVGAGKTYWNNVHVYDLSDAYRLLAEAAAAGGGKASWGKEGYYFTENGEHIWGKVSREITAKAHKMGLLKTDEVDSLDGDAVEELRPAGKFLWGANSRGTASRFRKELGWTPHGEAMSNTIEDLLKRENDLIKQEEVPPPRT